MYPEAMTIAVREHLPVLLVVMSDASYGSIRRAAVSRSLSQTALSLDSGYWKSVFAGFGAHTEHIATPAALQRALEAWRQHQRPSVFELIFDSHHYLRMTDGIR
jgi:thiamine pyrophosphate-dependent acetolactate synthase large subunit-like protein